MSWQKRIQNEIKNIIHYSIQPTENPFVWIAQIPGPADTPYEDQVFDIECRICQNYPFKAPYIRFLTPIYHANIHESGNPYCPLILDAWSPSLTFQTILLFLENLLKHPNASFGYNYEACQLLINDKEAYIKKAATWSKMQNTQSNLNHETSLSKKTD